MDIRGLITEIADLELTIKRLESGKYDRDEEKEYKDWLDDFYPPYEMGCFLTYYPSDILENCDPIAFRQGQLEYFDTLLTDLHGDLEDKYCELEELFTELDAI